MATNVPYDTYCHKQFICVDVLNSHFSFSLAYLVFLAFGILTIILFSSSMFAQRSYLADTNRDPLGLISPRYLTFRTKYRLASISYCVLLLLLYLVLALILDQPGIDLPSLGKFKASPVDIIVVRDDKHLAYKQFDHTVPLILAFMLIGVLPRIKLVETYEKRLREAVQEMFLIPTLGMSTANRLETAPIKLDANGQPGLSPAEVAGAERMLNEEVGNTLERVDFILSAREKINADRNIADADHIASYDDRFSALEKLKRKFCVDVKIILEIESKGPKSAVELLVERLQKDQKTLRDELRFLALVLAGALLRHTSNGEQINRALDRLGLVQSPEPIRPTVGDTSIAVAAWIACSFWVWDVSSAIIAQFGEVTANRIFPYIVSGTIDGIVNFLTYFFVLQVVLTYQNRRMNQQSWSPTGDQGYANLTDYLKLAILSIVVAAIWLMVLQSALFAANTNFKFMHVAILSLIYGVRVAVSVVFVALVIDYRTFDEKPSIVPQMVVFVFFAFLSGFIGGYFEQEIVNAGAQPPRTELSDAQWWRCFRDGLLGIWVFLTVAVAVFYEARYWAAEQILAVFRPRAPG